MTNPENKTTDENVNTQDDMMNETAMQPTPDAADDPLIPPIILLGIAAVALIVALFVWFTQPSFGGLGYGALAVMLISVLAWAVLNPDQVREIIAGRGLAFGGTAVVVVVLMAVAAVLVYSVVASFNWRVDVSQQNLFTLRDETRELIDTITSDPTIPSVQIIGFTTQAAAGQQDLVQNLLDDFEESSNGKITYEYIDINHNPFIAQNYGENISAGQYAVAPIDPETGEPIPGQAEVIQSFDQILLTNAIITATASGDFLLRSLDVAEGIAIDDTSPAGADLLATELEERFKWRVERVNPLELTGDAVTLGAGATDGEVLMIPGGVEVLPDDVMQPILDYLDTGGDLFLLASFSPSGAPVLATGETFNDYMWENFGVRVRNDFVVDPNNVVQQGLLFLFSDLQPHPITTNATGGDVALRGHSIEIAETLPDNVTVDVLVQTSGDAYSVPSPNFEQAQSNEDLNALLQQQDGEPSGQLPMVVAVENSATGARVVISGGVDLILNNYANAFGSSIVNVSLARQAIFWSANYDDFVGQLASIQATPADQEAAITLDDQDLSRAGFVVLFLLPFGLLFTGFGVLWSRRQNQ